MPVLDLPPFALPVLDLGVLAPRVLDPAASELAASPAALVAEIQSGVLLRSFLIAVVLLTPVWILVRRRVLGPPSDAAAPLGDERGSTGAPRLEDVIAEVPAAAATAIADGSATLEVPFGSTIDGAPVDDATVDVLVRDALRRSGVVVAAEIDTAGGRSLELRPAAVGREP